MRTGHPVYASIVDQEAQWSESSGGARVVTVTSMLDAKAAVETLRSGFPMLLVLRCGDDDRQRVTDLLVGWSLGAGGSLDRLGPNALAARPPGTASVRLSGAGILSAVDEAFQAEGTRPLTREEEQHLIPLAAAGSAEARQRLLDGYAEVATLLALWLRPAHLEASSAISSAQEELERLIAWPPRDSTLLVALVARLVSRLRS